MKIWRGRSLVFGILIVALFTLWILFPAVAYAGQKETKARYNDPKIKPGDFIPAQIAGQKVMKAPYDDLKIKPGDFIATQIVVFAKTEVAKKDILKLARAVGGGILHENTHFDMFLFSFLTDTDAEDALKKINKKYVGLYSASRNWKFGIPPKPTSPKETQGDTVQPQHVTDDPGLQAQWWLYKIKEPYTTLDAGYKNIAIIDTGVDYTHSELEGKVVSVFDYVNWDTDAMDENGHGTHCAGIAAARANNTSGIHGVSPNSLIYAYRVLDKDGNGGWYQIITAVLAAADNPSVSILSLSLGGYLIYGSTDYNTFQSAVNYARYTKGKIVCVAAGNEANYNHFRYDYLYKKVYYREVPGYFPESFTVGASDYFDHRAYFSNYDVSALPSGDATYTYNLTFVDVVAPGCQILSTVPGERYDSWDGTSMAAPMLAGACARVWGKNPTWTNLQVMQCLLNTGRSVTASLGWPVSERRIDLMKALGVSLTGIQGFVNHAEAAYPLYSVTVQALSGSSSGPVVATTTTNKSGMFTLTGLTGGTNYYLKFTKTSYNTSTYGAYSVTANYIKDIDQPFYLVPSRAETATDQNWRIIATWYDVQPGYYDQYYVGSASTWYPFMYYQSAGLEANAYLKDPSGIKYYWNYTGALGVSPYVAYTYDSFSGSPLECHVIQRPKTGVYRYVLRADSSDYGWGAIKYGAGKTPIYPNYPVVKIYRGNVLKNSISSSGATRDGTGTKYWHVFDLDTSSGTITIVNKITDTSPL